MLNSTSRFPNIKNQVILTQTDTTVGFLSQDEAKLQLIKSRPSTKPFITVFQDLKSLKDAKIRVPNSRKKVLRRASKTTFIIKNRAFRIAQPSLNSSLLRENLWFYSTSANESGKNFNRDFCEEKTDIIIEDKNRLFEDKASQLYKINKIKTRRLR